MNLDQLYSELTIGTDAKLVLAVLDGLGDIASPDHDRQTPLEAARTPHLDRLSQDSAHGRMIPVAPGITPGSGPGHLGLFGYDPLEYQVGRGVIEALGLGVDLGPGDIAARANFCTLDSQGVVTDRRAGRVETKTTQRLCAKIAENVPEIDKVRPVIQPGKDHRFVVVFRGQGLGGPLSDADPHREGKPIPTAHPVEGSPPEAQRTAELISKFYEAALPVLADESPANGFLMRGIAPPPTIPAFEARYKLKAGCIATYPMYKGLAQLVGMTKLEGPQTIDEQFKRYREERAHYDYFFIHYKAPDMWGEDGNFEAKKEAIEAFDAALPVLMEQPPDVLAITGDHSTPCRLQAHSWHPQPVLLHSPYSGSDKLERFTETGSNLGSLGIFEAKHLIRLMQANARMLDKFGA